ncbi:MAG: hypothetical protein CMB99_11625 [Flavobacteriaceae bacterium]|nr:hypothetical protein [Flavobacteriaceae bacterium]|tara:strand:- start:235468 stop:235839 length:372 start_codon:yes stop_codon:yes gene_type:complete
MKIDRILINICSDHLTKSRDFYTHLFDFEVGYESDWFIHLVSKEKGLELGIISKAYDAVPASFKNTPTGFYITIVVEDVHQIYELAKAEGFDIVSEPADTFYGQRRILLKDPDGALVDVSSPN